MPSPLVKIEFYVPVADADRVKQALFDAGAGKQGDYDSCAWQTAGRGQFRPLAGANPHLGEVGDIETVEEYKVEMVCRRDIAADAIRALKRAHPYEEVAYSVLELLELDI